MTLTRRFKLIQWEQGIGFEEMMNDSIDRKLKSKCFVEKYMRTNKEEDPRADDQLQPSERSLGYSSHRAILAKSDDNVHRGLQKLENDYSLHKTYQQGSGSFHSAQRQCEDKRLPMYIAPHVQSTQNQCTRGLLGLLPHF